MENETLSDKEVKELVEEALKKLLDIMGFNYDLEVKEEDEEGRRKVIFNIKTEESSFLIGQHGINLESLQHIARVVLRKKTSDKINFVVDVNSYRQEKNDSIVKLAHSLAEQAIIEKRAVVLRPMTPYERRIIHMELAKNDQVITESTGEGETRKVIIKPIGLF